MSFIRGALIVIASVLLFLALLTGGLFWTLSSSLQYENVQANAVDITKNLIEEQFDLSNQIDNNAQIIQAYCDKTGNPEFVFSHEGYTFTINCDSLQGGGDEFVDSAIRDFIEHIYYKEYNCDYWSCFEEPGLPLFLISEKSHDYWQNKFYFSLIAALVLSAVLFVLLKKRKNLPLLIGTLLIIASLPILGIQKITALFSDGLLKFSIIFFTQSSAVFIRMLIAGIILAAAGLILKLFGVGFKFYKLFSRESSEESNRNMESKPIAQKKDVKNSLKKKAGKTEKKK